MIFKVFYTNRFLKPWAGGGAYGPLIFIRPKYVNDIGLLEHEKTHCKQWWRTFGIHMFLYFFNSKYRLKSEVEAYRVQLTYGGSAHRFAEFISTRYDLDVSIEDAEKYLLNDAEFMQLKLF